MGRTASVFLSLLIAAAPELTAALEVRTPPVVLESSASDCAIFKAVIDEHYRWKNNDPPAPLQRDVAPLADLKKSPDEYGFSPQRIGGLDNFINLPSDVYRDLSSAADAGHSYQYRVACDWSDVKFGQMPAPSNRFCGPFFSFIAPPPNLPKDLRPGTEEAEKFDRELKEYSADIQKQKTRVCPSGAVGFSKPVRSRDGLWAAVSSYVQLAPLSGQGEVCVLKLVKRKWRILTCRVSYVS